MSAFYWTGAALTGFFTLVTIAKPRGVKKPTVSDDNWAAGIGTAIAVVLNVYLMLLLVHAARTLA